MSFLDGILGTLASSGLANNPEVANLAAKVGMTPQQAETAIAALAQAHPQPGDTVQTAAENTGMSPDILQQVLGHLGGEAGLASIAGTMLGGQGGQGGGIGGMLGGLASSFLGGGNKQA